MSGRCRWHLVFAVVGLLPMVGCVNLLPFGGDSTGRLSDTKAAGSRSPDLPIARKVELCLKVAEAEQRDGKLDQAIMQYELARHYDPGVKNVARRLAVLYAETGVPKKALAEYQKALQETPRDPDLINNLGYYHYTRGQWAEAETQYRKALAIDAKHKYAWVNLGMALAQQNRCDESLAAFQKVVSPAEAHSNLAFILTAQGKRAEAKLEYQKALDLEPDFTKARSFLQKLDQAEARAKTGADNRAANVILQPAPERPPQPAPLPMPPPVPEALPVPEKINLLPVPEKTPAPQDAVKPALLPPAPPEAAKAVSAAPVPGPNPPAAATTAQQPSATLPTPPVAHLTEMTPPGPFGLTPVQVPEAGNATTPATR